MMALLAPQVVWGYVGSEKGIPRSSESFPGAATRSPMWAGAGSGLSFLWAQHVGDLFPLLQAGWLPSCTQQLGLWASPSPSGLLQKAAAGQRLPTDLHNCTVP